MSLWKKYPNRFLQETEHYSENKLKIEIVSNEWLGNI